MYQVNVHEAKTHFSKLLKIGSPLDDFVENHVIGNDIRILNLATDHLFPLESLPLHHRDPFDRLLISQSMQEKAIAEYQIYRQRAVLTIFQYE